jgi:hypothetical protein
MTESKLEHAWRTWLADRNRRGMVTVSWIVLALYPAFGILDYELAPREALPWLYGTRSLVVLVTLLMFRGVRGPTFDRHHAAMSAAYTVLCASGITLMTVFLGGMSSPYYAGIILVIVGSGLLFVWPPKVVVATHASIVAGFVGANLLLHQYAGLVQALSNLFFLVSTAVITGIGQIVLHRLQREQISSRFALEQTKANLEQAND